MEEIPADIFGWPAWAVSAAALAFRWSEFGIISVSKFSKGLHGTKLAQNALF
jgi:hypothetical protein